MTKKQQEEHWLAFLKEVPRDVETIRKWNEDTLIRSIESTSFKNAAPEIVGDIIACWKDLQENSHIKRSRDKEDEEDKIKRAKIEHRKFSVNGAILDPREVYFVNIDTEAQVLATVALEGNYYLYYGHRGTGKSTRCYYTIFNYLKQAQCFFIDMQYFKGCKSTGEFWTIFGERMQKSSIPKIEETFDTFKSIEDYLCKSKETTKVLFLDEFEVMFLLAATIREEVFSILRAIKHSSREVIGRVSVIAIGPMSILKAPNVQLSPFSIANKIEVEYFTKQQVNELFMQYEQHRGVKVDSSTIEDIYSRTSGHPALVCYCGKKIQAFVESHSRDVQDLKSAWIEIAAFKLVRDLPAVGIYKDRVDMALSTQATDLLLNYFLNTKEAVIIGEKDNFIEVANMLAAEGLLRATDTNTYIIPSPLIRAMILRTVVGHFKMSVPSYLPINGFGLSVQQMLCIGLPYLDKAASRRAFLVSYKRNRATGADLKKDELAPDESFYQKQLFMLLRNWLPLDYEIDAEVNVEKKACDIVISNGGRRYALELVAHAAETGGHGSIEEHFERANSYWTIPQVSEVWVISITTRPPSRGYIWPKGNSKLQVAHVYHDKDCSQFQIQFKENEDVNKISWDYEPKI